MRTFAVGDIHGCLTKLEDLLQQINPRPDDRLIFLGDYIDRGPDSPGVIDCLLALNELTECVFLKGNHEDMFLRYLEDGDDAAMYLANGGLATITAYLEKIGRRSGRRTLKKAIPPEHLHFFENLGCAFEDENYIYVHAGIQPGIPLRMQDQRTLLWIRHEFMEQNTGLAKKVVFGHTHIPEPFIRSDKIGIDTGAVFGGPLTAIELPQETFIQSRIQGPCL